jgi:peptidoglycan-N-acetylglucosamine deacetylase
MSVRSPGEQDVVRRECPLVVWTCRALPSACAPQGPVLSRPVAQGIQRLTGSLAAVAVAATGGWALGLASSGAALAAGATAGAAALGSLAAASMAPSLQAFGPAVCRGVAGPRVALTFDDGPDPASTARLCDALEAAGARATFFLLADRAAAHPALVRRIAAAHEIALHGPTHDAWLTVQRPEVGEARLRAAAALLAEIGGQPIRWFRPPFGATSPRLAEAVRRAGLQTVWCSVRPYDAGLAGPARVLARVRRAGPGDIVLLHEGRRPALDILPAALADLAARSLRAVTVGELLEPG